MLRSAQPEKRNGFYRVPRFCSGKSAGEYILSKTKRKLAQRSSARKAGFLNLSISRTRTHSQIHIHIRVTLTAILRGMQDVRNLRSLRRYQSNCEGTQNKNQGTNEKNRSTKEKIKTY